MGFKFRCRHECVVCFSSHMTVFHCLHSSCCFVPPGFLCFGRRFFNACSWLPKLPWMQFCANSWSQIHSHESRHANENFKNIQQCSLLELCKLDYQSNKPTRTSLRGHETLPVRITAIGTSLLGGPGGTSTNVAFLELAPRNKHSSSAFQKNNCTTVQDSWIGQKAKAIVNHQP